MGGEDAVVGAEAVRGGSAGSVRRRRREGRVEEELWRAELREGL